MNEDRQFKSVTESADEEIADENPGSTRTRHNFKIVNFKTAQTQFFISKLEMGRGVSG